MKNKIKRIVVALNLINILSVPLFLFRIFKIKKNRIVFSNFTLKDYGDSPKYIAEHLLKNDEELELYWVVKDKKKNTVPNSIKTVKFLSLRYFYVMATSKIWVSNSRLDQFVIKRHKQVYIQTWHGGLALKKIEYDAEDKMSQYYKKVMKKDSKHIDYLISNGDFCTKMYKRAFKTNATIKEYGTPRNDCLVNEQNKKSENVRNKLGIAEKTHIVLYAPTFRSNYDSNPYDIDFAELKKQLEKKTGQEWKIIIKLHPRLSDMQIGFDEKVIDATKYSDIQELICACDILITDYSSTMFESMIARKTVILYAKDIEDYKKERGYYFAFEDLPFPLAKTNGELMNIIKNYDGNRIVKSYNKFIDSIGLIEKGDAAKKVSELIMKRIKNDDNQ